MLSHSSFARVRFLSSAMVKSSCACALTCKEAREKGVRRETGECVMTKIAYKVPGFEHAPLPLYTQCKGCRRRVGGRATPQSRLHRRRSENLDRRPAWTSRSKSAVCALNRLVLDIAAVAAVLLAKSEH